MSTLISTEDPHPQLIGGSCRACGNVSFPAQRRCTRCGETHIDPHRVGPVGHLYSYTVVHLGRGGEPTPYAIGVADFPEDVRLVARLEGWQQGVAIGDPVTVHLAAEDERREDDRANLRLRMA